MIVGEQKPFEEIWEMIKQFKKLTVLGCNTCVAVCHQGGSKEAELLASLLRMKAIQENIAIEIVHSGIERQCEHEFYESAQKLIQESEAVLSLACGIGVQFIASKYTTTPVYPALNTTFLGDVVEKGVYTETCQACGGAARVIACIEDPQVIKKILTHLEKKARAIAAPRLNPNSRAPPQASLFG